MKMTANYNNNLLSYFLALIWLVNGLVCKLLNLVPRHQEIVATILGVEHAVLFTRLIGVAEILMALWILSRYLPKLNAWVQIVVILLMNFLEFMLVPQLLLWGKWNLLFAILLVGVIFYFEFGFRLTRDLE